MIVISRFCYDCDAVVEDTQFHNYHSVVSRIILHIVNKSLAEGIFAATLKQAIVIPIIKDKSKDKNDLKGYRPISTLPYLSKVIEYEIHQQVTTYLDEESLFPMFQSAYRSSHSCETAIFKVTHDMKKKCIKIIWLRLYL